ncbi:MAG: hypothetical protein ACX94C_07660 [Phycisphaerales bacterium]
MPTGPFEDSSVSSATFGTTYNTSNVFVLPENIVSRRDELGLVLDLSTSSSTATQLTFKLQTYDPVSGAWADVYRDDGSGTFELEEYVIDDLSADTGDQLRAIRLSIPGIPSCRIVGKSNAQTVMLSGVNIAEVSRTHGG